jgi:hypothetical protein
VYLDTAIECESVNDAIKFTGFGELALKLAQFCVDNHALVAGIDEDAPLSHRDSTPGFGPKAWGGPPVPKHIQQAEQERYGERIRLMDEQRRLRKDE